MNLTGTNWIAWGLTVAGAVLGVCAAVSAVPTGWSWPAFFSASAAACTSLGVAWGKLSPAVTTTK